MTALDPPCRPDCPTCNPGHTPIPGTTNPAVVDALLLDLTERAIVCAKAGATTDQIDAAARRGYMLADPRRYTPDPKDRR
jgi:hypothetical protein